MPPTFNLIGVVVADMARALAFYRRLGLGLPSGADTEPHVEVALPGGLRLAFDSPAEVDKVYGELVAAGYHGDLEPWDAFWEQRYASVADPRQTVAASCRDDRSRYIPRRRSR